MTETQSNRPKDYPLLQQKLKAWKPILTFKDASIFFFVTGVIVLAIGIAIFIPDSKVQEYTVDYTECANPVTNTSCSDQTNIYNGNCTCTKSIQIISDIPAPVYFYYGMNNFYQNHRQLIKSYDMNQLMGQSVSSDSCNPVYQNKDSKTYAPCGQMANVMFNDSFSLSRNNDQVSWTTDNISLYSDKIRYGTPSSWSDTVPPPNWRTPVYQRSPNAYAGYEELMVWMRPAPLPKFRKLYRILIANGSFSNGLPAGNYTLNINYAYPVKSFDGQKYFIVTNLSWIGGKNAAIGILYLITGSIEIVIGIALLILHKKYPTKPNQQTAFDMSSYL